MNNPLPLLPYRTQRRKMQGVGPNCAAAYIVRNQTALDTGDRVTVSEYVANIKRGSSENGGICWLIVSMRSAILRRHDAFVKSLPNVQRNSRGSLDFSKHRDRWSRDDAVWAGMVPVDAAGR